LIHGRLETQSTGTVIATFPAGAKPLMDIGCGPASSDVGERHLVRLYRLNAFCQEKVTAAAADDIGTMNLFANTSLD
jgi:hypothetical protein